MANKTNFQRELDSIIAEIQKSGETPSLLLHSCCAPCSSYVLEYLSQYFKITVFYYNPNIWPEEEYFKRVAEQERFIKALNPIHPIHFMAGEYDTKRFYDVTKGMEHEKEGGIRCFACYRLRLEECAKMAKEQGFDYFCTTLSISPLKNAEKLNEIGNDIAEMEGLKFLPSDFKKKGGYLNSIELSKKYGLYRQDYCGCIFSKPKDDEQ
ncbi:MAG TPA: epoxyqueuosine reductase QueH [Paludibacteraceae bacterium]|nr:epoxyqueuosine reductase QueH [Paludibacteraceae bacterium]HOU69263.1 epoxyqueuosine reductase QueH [Paludibacteraceae bacterium]HPH63597.1 epoxyqueuosine reductase QueH [Paludibacteraceae bacterium]HQF51017.1 epoxyqueuosine reductase QueH [Paludibacteraceae bacterium]